MKRLFVFAIAAACLTNVFAQSVPRATPAPSILTKGLFAEYRLDEGTGTKLNSTAKQPQIPNANLWAGTESFTDFSLWSGASGITDRYALGPFGRKNAARWVNSTAGARVNQNLALTAGQTYTMSCYLASNTGVAQAIRPVVNNGDAGPSDVSIPAAGWIRYSYTFTANYSSGVVFAPIGIDGAGDANDILVYGPMLEKGSTASDYIAESSTLDYAATIGGNSWSNFGYVLGAGGVNGNYFRGNVPQVSAANVTLYAVARWPTANTAANQIGLFGGDYGNGGSTGTFRIEAGQDGKNPFFRYGTASAPGVGGWDLRNWHDGAWHLLTGTYDASTSTIRLYIDDCLIGWATSTQTPRIATWLNFGSLNGNYCFGGEIAYAAAYNLAHTQAQQLQQFTAIYAHMASHGVTLASLQKLVVFEGDSITNGNGSATPYASVIAPQLQVGSVFPQVFNFAAASATILNNAGNDLTTRWASESLMFNIARSNGVYCGMIGHNDLGLRSVATVFANLKTFYQTLRAAGVARRLLIAVTPTTATALGGANGNTARNQLNALLRADTSGDWTFVDTDLDQTLNGDAVASDASQFADGIHPTTAWHARAGAFFLPYVQAALQ